ncbi:hypothetical protein DFH09DRAFT_1407648 [Mycena vulgaris]|nr:hypothetical protein DFH09DRAFT_1407648 [Mycena vulgaris]
MSVFFQDLPISFYSDNRSFGNHRLSDSLRPPSRLRPRPSSVDLGDAGLAGAPKPLRELPHRRGEKMSACEYFPPPQAPMADPVSQSALRQSSRDPAATPARSSIITKSSSGADPLPLLSAEGSSRSAGSQSSIHMSQSSIAMSRVNVILSNATHPISTTARDRVRARARGHGHRHHISDSSVYETIQEMASPAPSSVSRKSSSPTTSFQPPKKPKSMQALLQHLVQNYTPLPSDLGPRRVHSRTQSRVSPCSRQGQAAASHENQPQRPSPAELRRAFVTHSALQPLEVNANVDLAMPPAIMSPKRENTWGLTRNARPGGASAARRSDGRTMQHPSSQGPEGE